MTVPTKSSELVFAVSMTAISLALFFGTYSYPVESVTFPRFLVVLSVLFSALLIIRAIRLPADRQSPSQSALRRIGFPIKVFTGISIYIAAIEILGFYCASAIFLLASMFMYGSDGWAARLAVTGGFLLVIYIVFGWLIGVRLPAGLLF